VPGLAQSEPIEVSFKAAIDDFPFQFNSDNRELTVGPINSFMGQLIPDGVPVMVTLTSSTESIYNVRQPTLDGTAIFDFSELELPSGAYTVTIETLGIIHKITAVELK